MREKFLMLKTLVVETVLWAEKNLKGKTGAEKKKVVADLVMKKVSALPLPWYLSLIKSVVAPRLINYLIDKACEIFNPLSGKNFENVDLTATQIVEVACVLDAPAEVVASCGEATFNERIDELYQKYEITSEEKCDKLTPDGSLTRREITCKCGCGFDMLSQETIETFQAIRDYIGKPIIITSGCRCPEHNANIKPPGAKNSSHISGEALDMHVNGMSARQFGDKIKKCHAEGKIPHLRYCYLMDTSVHIDTDSSKNRNSIWGW